MKKILLTLIISVFAFTILNAQNGRFDKITIKNPNGSSNADALLSIASNGRINESTITIQQITDLLSFGFDVWRKQDELTPADSFSEIITHSGGLVLNGETRNLSFDNTFGSTLISNVGVSGTTIQTNGIATDLTLIGNTGINMNIINQNRNDILHLNGNFLNAISTDNLDDLSILLAERNFTIPGVQSVRPNFKGISISPIVNYSASPTYNNNGDFSSIFINPTLNGVENHYAINGSGKIKLSDYGSLGTTGVPTSLAAWDTDGNLIETNLFPTLQEVTNQGNITSNGLILDESKLTIQTNVASQSALSTYIQNDEGNSFSTGINGLSNYIISAGPSLTSPRLTIEQNGGSTFSSTLSVQETLKVGVFTVATLPAGQTGMIAYVTDASAISYRAIATGGGSSTALVFFDGANWIYH